MTNHDLYLEKISLWLDNRLDAAESAALEAHLRLCPTCRQTHAAMQMVDAQLRQAAQTVLDPSPGFTRQVEARLDSYRQSHRRLWAGMVILLVGSLVLVGVTVAAASVSLLTLGQALTDPAMLVYGLRRVGEFTHQFWLVADLLRLVVRVALAAVQQPLFWGMVLVSFLLTGLWVKILRSLYRRTAVHIT